MEQENKHNKPIIADDNFVMMRFGREEIGTPVADETFGRNKWIDYGKNNDYPQELIRLYQNASGLHKSLCDRKADMIAGAGFDPIASLKPFLSNEYSEDTLDMVAFKCALDIVIFGGYYLKVIFSDGGKIGQVDHCPFEKVRIEKPCSDDEAKKINGFYISPNWTNYKKSANTPVWVKSFDHEASGEYKEQLFYVRTYCAGMDYYTIPTYSAALNWIKLDWEISTFHLKNVQNGLMPGMIIVNKNGLPPAHMREAEYNAIKQRYGGAENSGDIIMLYAESPDKAPDFVPIELNGSDKRFKDLMVQIDNEIMRAAKFTSAIAGIETAGKLGSKNEMTEQLEMLQLTVIRPLQKIIEDSFNKLGAVNGLPAEFKLNEYKLFKEDEEIEEEVIDKNAEAQATLRGSVGGVQSLTLILEKIASGLMNRASAIATLELIFGFTNEQALRLIGDTNEETNKEEGQ